MNKRILIAIVSLLLVCVAVKAVEYTPRFYGYSHKQKELRKFYNKCVWSWAGSLNLSEKDYLKLQNSYKQLVDKYPEDKYMTMLYYGYMNVMRNCPIANKEEGLKMMIDALPHISDPSLKSLVATTNANIACCFLKGIGTEKDGHQSLLYFQKAFELDSICAENMAYLYLTGVGMPIDEERAFSLFHDCYNSAVAGIGQPIIFYPFKPYSYEDFYEKLYAIQINKHGVDSIGKESYREGLRHFYIYEDYDRAKECFERAVDLGITSAVYEMGMLYHFKYINSKGEESKESKRERDKWLAKAAEAKYYPAIYKQGMFKMNGNAVFVAQENKANADAYPYFKQLADIGYGPGIVMVKKYDMYGWSKEANLFGDIAKGVLSVSAMATSIKNDGWAAGLTSQMNNTGKQYGEIKTVDDFLGALQLQNEQLEAKKRAKESASYSTDGNTQYSVGNDTSIDDSSISTDSYTSTSRTTNKTSGSTNKSYANNNTSSSTKASGTSTRNCRKCGGSGRVNCQRCKGTTRSSCAGCSGKGYISVVGAGKRECTLCNGKGTTKCIHCNSKGTEKCTACNGKGQVNN